ncbi:hypothetical protein JYU34_000235 [Plutella xylostella]|uniref:Uncharacterized protein n=2 Tax=Plutella xylostella TaxID=51655 RepID=A0ABQ7R778_PLUXY|nr:zinc finger and BTB domain-containing protein 17 [Plutella xylostella]KAG7313146.1 hypothetical protein JYU34_000235 [Plutella xylostella]CAG9138150.1 unnamed protein product [Plutella xylostella]
MAMPEQFSLRWNDFHSNLSQGFHALLEGEDLVDVTLAAGGQYVHAHKLILSVCSPYFKELFKMNPCEHPIVILKDVALSELRQLLQFMYKGEVHVRQQELSGFLHTAELLQVKGLTAGREKSESPPPARAKDEPITSFKAEQSNDSLTGDWVPGGEDTIATEASVSPSNITSGYEEESAKKSIKRTLKNTPPKTNMNSKKSKAARPPPPVSPHHDSIEYTSDSEPQLDYDSDLYHSILEMPDPSKDSIINIKQEGGWNCKTGGVKCPSCNRFFANRYNLKVHIRDKHDTLEGTLQCEICKKRMRNPSCLRVHMYHHRKQAAYLAAQTDQMHKLMPNMIVGKWRQDGSIPSTPINPNDFRDQDKKLNMSGKWPSLPHSPMNPSDYKDDKKQNMSKWSGDPPSPTGPDYKDQDSAQNNSGGEEGLPPNSVDVELTEAV